MNILLTVLLTVQILSALVMTGLILVQHGKGADMGAAFGSGTSGSLFGASGSANFLSRSTSALAAVFFVSTLALAYFGSAQPRTGSSVLEGTPAAQQIPGAAPAPQAGSSEPVAPAPVVPGPAQIPSK
jgi:preprotein translocase subunit SecG